MFLQYNMKRWWFSGRSNFSSSGGRNGSQFGCGAGGGNAESTNPDPLDLGLEALQTATVSSDSYGRFWLWVVELGKLCE